MTAPAAAPAKKTAKKSAYTVLYTAPPSSTNSSTNGSLGWTVVASDVQASNTEQAIKAAVATTGNKPGRYIAVPKKSWQPVAITVETQTIIKLGEAS